MRDRKMLTLGVFASIVAGMIWVGVAAGGQKTPWNAPEEAAKVINPYPATPATVSDGKEVFTRQCTPCHGASGVGDGPASKFLGKQLPNFTTADFQKQTDGELFWKISNGNAPMPTFKDIMSDEQRWTVIDYLRTFAPKEEKGGGK